MNLEKINDLTTIAARLADAGSAANGVIHRIVGLIDKELDAAEPNAQAEELKALQASNEIKQANLNLLAGAVIDLFRSPIIVPGEGEPLLRLAKSLIQEEQLLGEASSNGVAPGQLYQVATEIDPVAKVVDNLKRARAEVLRLVELRKQTSNQDGEVADAHVEACEAFNRFRDELVKAIDASLK